MIDWYLLTPVLFVAGAVMLLSYHYAGQTWFNKGMERQIIDPNKKIYITDENSGVSGSVTGGSIYDDGADIQVNISSKIGLPQIRHINVSGDIRARLVNPLETMLGGEQHWYFPKQDGTTRQIAEIEKTMAINTINQDPNRRVQETITDVVQILKKAPAERRRFDTNEPDT